MRRTTAITGIGVVSPVGTGRIGYWEALFKGTAGFRPVTLFDASPWNASTAGEIADFDPLPLLGKKGLRDLDRSTRLLSVAAKLALDDSGLPQTEEACRGIGISIGATYGSLHSISQFDRVGITEGPRSVNPSHFPNTVLNSPASQVSIRFKFRGFNTTVSTGFCAGLDALCYAADQIRLGRAPAAFAGGVEELCEETMMAFHGMGWLSGSDGSAPRCCPFDRRRNGIVCGEGAAVMLLEDGQAAQARGARVLAFLLGYGTAFDRSADASFELAGDGLEAAIRSALRAASLASSDIDVIFSSANSSAGLDRMEARVIRKVFGDRAGRIPVCAVKSMIGETCSAAGALAAVASCGSLERGLLPPTVNLCERDAECDLDHVVRSARAHEVRRVLVLAADPYGPSTAVILGKGRIGA